MFVDRGSLVKRSKRAASDIEKFLMFFVVLTTYTSVRQKCLRSLSSTFDVQKRGFASGAGENMYVESARARSLCPRYHMIPT